MNEVDELLSQSFMLSSVSTVFGAFYSLFNLKKKSASRLTLMGKL